MDGREYSARARCSTRIVSATVYALFSRRLSLCRGVFIGSFRTVVCSYIDTSRLLVYFFPPEPQHSVDGPPIALMYQAGGVVNVTSDAKNVKISDMEIINGRHSGILAEGAAGLTIERVQVHAHGSHGIVLTSATDGGSIIDSEVYDVGCSGIRATAGASATLDSGGLLVAANHVHHVAQWKRSYMPVRRNALLVLDGSCAYHAARERGFTGVV
eukprot:COSAG01_NODE_3597_length_5894_cov_1.898188_6_plen_214_part_00